MEWVYFVFRLFIYVSKFCTSNVIKLQNLIWYHDSLHNWNLILIGQCRWIFWAHTLENIQSLKLLIYMSKVFYLFLHEYRAANFTWKEKKVYNTYFVIWIVSKSEIEELKSKNVKVFFKITHDIMKMTRLFCLLSIILSKKTKFLDIFNNDMCTKIIT